MGLIDPCYADEIAPFQPACVNHVLTSNGCSGELMVNPYDYWRLAIRVLSVCWCNDAIPQRDSSCPVRVYRHLHYNDVYDRH